MFKKRKSSSAVLLGSAAASMAACSAQNTAKASLNIYFDILGEATKPYHPDVAGLCKNFTWKNYVLDALKLPWSIYRWISYDSWVSFLKQINQAQSGLLVMFAGLPLFMWACVWLAVQAGVIYSVYSGIKGVLKYSKTRKNKAMLKELNEKNTLNIDKFAKKVFKKEDFSFIEKIQAKYGKEYSDSLKERFLLYLLGGNEYKSCEKYFEDFVLDHPESDDYFNRHKNVAEKDYGLIGPKVVTQEDKKFIDEEFSSLKEELEFLKEKRKFKSDQDTLEDFLSSYVEYCHLCNKRKKEEKELEKSGKNSLSAKEYFFGAYMNNISAKTAINGFEYLAPGGNDYSVNKYWNAKDKGYGLRYENTLYSPNNLNDVSYEDSELFEKMLIKSSNEKEVKDCFKEYVFYLHDCNKQFKKAEKGFKAFFEEKNIPIEGLENAEQINS